MNKIKKHLHFLLLAFHYSNQAALAYRADYALRIVRSLLEVVVTVVIIETFFAKTPAIVGWGKYETMLVFGTYYLTASIVMTHFGAGIEGLYRRIIKGELDLYLTLPIDAQFYTSASRAYITNIFRTAVNIVVVWYALSHLTISLSFLQLVLTLISWLSALVVYYCLSFAVSLISFWTFSGELWYLMDTISSTMRFPVDFYPKLLRFFLLFIPLAFTASVPVSALLGRSVLLPLISPMVAIISFILTRKLWFAGLRSYESAST